MVDPVLKETNEHGPTLTIACWTCTKQTRGGEQMSSNEHAPTGKRELEVPAHLREEQRQTMFETATAQVLDWGERAPAPQHQRMTGWPLGRDA